jgi:hypothetical protein
MNKNLTAIERSTYWLEEIVIGLDLCPFARIPYKNGLVRLIENESILESDQLSFFLDELELLQKSPASIISTTLIVYSKDKNDFDNFNDFVGLCEDMLIESALEEHFQLIAFHPEFQFEGKDINDRSNWVGRAPYSTIHILRNSEIELALESSIDMKEISIRNEERISKMSDEEFNLKFNYFV